MSLGSVDSALELLVRELVEKNKDRIFPGATGLRVENVEFGKSSIYRGKNFHLPVTVRAKANNDSYDAELWLKSQEGLNRVFPLLSAYYELLGAGVIPKPIFAWGSQSGPASILVMSRVNGKCIRDILLKRTLFRRAGSLAPIFVSNGNKMRRFHDAFPASGQVPTSSIFENTAELLRSTRHLDSAEKSKILLHLGRHQNTLSSVNTLPLFKLHHDWVLRNILVDEDGTDVIIDFESMQYPDNLRWYDVGCFLMNVESQLKWSPLVNIGTLRQIWRSFWHGYTEAAGAPDGLNGDQIAALLYVVRINYLYGGTFRPADLDRFTGFHDRRFFRSVRQNVLAGHHTELE